MDLGLTLDIAGQHWRDVPLVVSGLCPGLLAGRSTRALPWLVIGAAVVGAVVGPRVLPWDVLAEPETVAAGVAVVVAWALAGWMARGAAAVGAGRVAKGGRWDGLRGA